MENKNAGLIATQNRDCRMAYESFLKSYSAVVDGCNGKEELLKLVLGKKDYMYLTNSGISKFCYDKVVELYKKFPFPQQSQAMQELADSLGAEEVDEEIPIIEEEINQL